MALWRDVSSAAILPLNATDTAWRVREAIPAILVRRFASCRDHALENSKQLERMALFADEIDNGGLDASGSGRGGRRRRRGYTPVGGYFAAQLTATHGAHPHEGPEAGRRS